MSYFLCISLEKVAQHVSGNHVPIIRSWWLRDVIALCWYIPWLQESGQDRLSFTASIGRTTYQPVLTTFLQLRHIPNQGYNITQSSAPDDGYIVAETCWAIVRREIKNRKSDIYLVLLIHNELRCRFNNTLDLQSF